MLVIRELQAHYGRVAALQGVSLEVEQGTVVGLVGPNGGGKSTLLRCVMGVHGPTAGDVLLDGASIVGLAPDEIVRRGVSLVPEGRRIFANMTVAENLRLAALAISDRRAMRAAIERELARFPILGEYLHSSAASLSGGEQQQLAIARALLPSPRLLLLDEPTLGLAPLMVDVVFDTLGACRADGVTVLLVEQNAARTARFSDRTYVLRTGRVRRTGEREEFLADSDFASAYLGL